ncbi:MAG TPA: lantibiotic dehydratase [Micromonosporaceae bacterium]|jgi:hypothetical protein|nr:lantibiotic dehydratase [Micromonosporaceae bacterium]
MNNQLLPLPGTGWHVWRSAVLRAAGFPAAGLDRLAAPDCAKVADAHLAGDTDRDSFAAAFDRTVRELTGQLCEIAADPLFREAVTWQSLNAVEAVDGLVRAGPGASRGWRQREREILVTRYWQRYCGKNDTIGFFGPVCWARFEPDGPAVQVHPGPGPLRRRVVDLEWRALSTFADRLAGDPRYRPWLPVIRAPQLALDGDRLLRVGAAPLPLSPAASALLAASDGTRTASQVVARALADPESGLRKEADGYLVLTQLAGDGTVHWGLDVPLAWSAEQRLRGGLAAIGDPGLRAEAQAAFARLSSARDALAAAAGDPDAVRTAVRRLESEYAEVTGGPVQHRPGATYAGRGLAYEDTVRDLDVALGPEIRAALAAPLAPLLQAARWLTTAMATAYAGTLRALYDEAVAETGSATVSLGELWYLTNGVMFGGGPAADVLADFVDRWERVIGVAGVDPALRRIIRDSADLARAAATTFPATAPGWSAARLHSPDIQLCADSAAALSRGEFTAVLGELHVAWLTADAGCLTRFHPDPAALRDQLHQDLGDRVVLLFPPDFPELTARMAPTLTGPADVALAYADAPAATLDGVLPLASLTASLVDGELVAATPDGRTWHLLELFGPFLSALAVNAFKLAGAGPHTPRVTVDRLVVLRETWRTTVGESGLVGPETEADRYLAARRWRARLDLPERVFARVGTELKPCFVDLTSPAYVAAFAAMVRSAYRAGGDGVPLVVTEMLPTPEQAWVPDAEGRRYLSELRFTVRDPVPAATSRGEAP